MSAVKGYVVRGTNPRGVGFKAPCKTMSEAVGEWLACATHEGTSDVRILAVAPDGTETPLPTYEEALGLLNATRAATCTPMALDALPAFMHGALTESVEIGHALSEIQVLAEELEAVLRGTMAGDALGLVSRISALTLPSQAAPKSATPGEETPTLAG